MNKIPTAKQIIHIIEEIAPKVLALPGDPVGLQCGESDRPVSRMMVSLDASLEAVVQAAKIKADLLVTHHPLLFEPLTPEAVSGSAGRAFTRAIQDNLVVYSAHTNLDASPEGINASLAGLLDLSERKVLQATGSEFFKVVVFIPRNQLERVKSSAFKAGAGQIGGYSGCSFAVEGVGTFHPGVGTAPVTGRVGRDVKVQEVRLELSVRSDILAAVIAGVRKVHPYEEPAIDIYPMISSHSGTGLGLIGKLPQFSTVGQVASRISSALKTDSLRMVGKKGSRIKTVAVCAGSGASLLDTAIAAGAQLYITGDLKYHDARRAEDAGIHLLDVGHFAPERYGTLRFGKLLRKKFAEHGLNVQLSFAKERDPFVPV